MLESIFKFIFRLIFKFILQMFSCKLYKIFKRTFFTEHLQATASAGHLDLDILFTGIWDIWKVSLLVTVHPFLLLSRSFNLFWSCAKWFFVWWFLIQSAIIAIYHHSCCTLTNQTVFDDMSLEKIEARCMMALFLRFYCLPRLPRFYAR